MFAPVGGSTGGIFPGVSNEKRTDSIMIPRGWQNQTLIVDSCKTSATDQIGHFFPMGQLDYLALLALRGMTIP